MKRLLFIPALMALVTAAFGAEGPLPILPVSDVRPGMKGVGYSVFEGTTLEEFPVEVVGVLKNVWGPRQHIILVRVGGRPAKTGVAAGMSGSPVYIDGKWLGAISLRLGYFPTEPLAGVTPAESMLEIQESDASQPSAPTVLAGIPPTEAAAPADRVMASLSALLPSPLPPLRAANSYLIPIETPLVFSGFSESVLNLFTPLFQRMGMMAVQGGAETVSGPLPSQADAAKELPPGSAVSGMLVTGDLSLAATGTVAYNDGRRILAFGHPFFGVGSVEMPMSKAEIVTTLGSSFAPFKIANSTEIVGTIVQDRHSGILGILGKAPRMIPVTMTLHSPGQSFTYHYQVFQDQRWTPTVMAITFLNTLAQSNWSAADTSFKVEGSIEIKGHPPVNLNRLSVTPADALMTPGTTLVMWLSQKFNQIFQNRFERPEVTSVNLDLELIPDVRLATIENVWGDSTEVHPGDLLAVKVALRPYRGERTIKEVTIRIPESAPRGYLRVRFSDAETLSQTQELFALQQNRFSSLGEIIGLMNREKSNQELYVTLLEQAPTAFHDDKLLPSIPSTIANVLDSARAASRLTLLNETVIGQSSYPMDVVVTGSQNLTLNVN